MAAHDHDNVAVRMLMDHLASVKLAAEEREYHLRTQIDNLAAALKSMESQQQECEDELELARSTIHELKTQQSKKWRLEALDDWKALVNQLNADRSRLQQEVDSLKGENDRLVHEIRRVKGGMPSMAPDGAGHAADGAGSGGGSEEEGAMMMSPPSNRILEELRAELSSLRRHMGLLEVQKRETEMELQKLKRQVKDALGNGQGLLSGYLLQSVMGFLGGNTKKGRYQKPAYTPVLSV